MKHINNALSKLIKICYEYKLNKLGLATFIHNLGIVMLPDECTKELAMLLEDSIDELDFIIYGGGGTNEREVSIEIADRLINAAKLERERLKNYRPYG
jgi:hypothetical protein